MLRLRTFGGLSIERADGSSSATSTTSLRRRVALLAVLAANGGEARGVPRDKLLALFWPESDTDRARHALDQTLYALKRELSADQLVLGREELSLNPNAITSDLGDFRKALLQRDHATAVALYTGSFLDGVYISGAPEFERWADDERAALARAVENALETLASQAASRGDHAGAAHWLERLSARNPRKTKVVVALMSELAASGDRTAALRHAEIYHTLVRDDPDVEPNPAVAALAEKLKREPTAPPVASAAGTMPVAAVAPEVEPTRAEPVQTPPPRRRGARYRLAAVAATIAAAAVLLAFIFARRDKAAEHVWVLPADIENRTGDSMFNHALDAALTTGLQQSAFVNVYPRAGVQQTLKRMGRENAGRLDETLAREIAQREGVAAVVAGDIARVDSTYVVTLRVVQAGNGVALTAASRVAHRRTDVIDAMDDLVRRLRRAIGESAAELAKHDRPLPRATTRSLEALHKFAAGNAAYEAGQRREGFELWQQAVALDSDFALAHVSLGMAAYFGNNRPLGDTHFSRALSLLDRLTDREQLTVRATVESWRGNRDRAIELRRALLAEYPDDRNTWGAIGYDYLRLGRYRDAIDAYGRQLARDSSATAYLNLAEAYSGAGDHAESLRNFQRAFALQPSLLTVNNLNHEYGSMLVLAGRLAEARAAYDTMLHGDNDQRAQGERSIGLLLMYQGRYAEAIEHLRQAVLLSRIQNRALTEARNHLFLAAAEQEKGWRDSARVELRAAHALFRRTYFEPAMLMLLGKALVRDGQLPLAAEVLDSLHRRAKNLMDSANVAVLQGEIALARGRPDSALGAMRLAFSADSSGVVAESLAHALAAAGDLAGAAKAYEALASARKLWYGWEAQPLALTAANAAAGLYERAGNTAAAQRASARQVSQWAGGDGDLVSLRQALDRLSRLR